MQRGASIVLGTMVLALAAWLTLEGMRSPRHPEARLAVDASVGIGFALTINGDAGLWQGDMPALGGSDARGDASGVGNRMPDGTQVPGLPADAPRSVRFGVVLVQYAGAEGAPSTARPRQDAIALAAKLSADAKTDFHGAVRRGDDGSTDDAGRIQRGVLELGVEYFLFTLPVGQTSEPIDTPRGFWITKRLE